MKLKLFAVLFMFSCLAFLWTGCEKPPPPEGALLEYVFGDGQVHYITKPLPDSLSVRVLDQYGEPFAGEVVTFSVTSGGGSLSATSVVSDANGYAVTYWTLGDTVGTQRVEATANVASGSPIVFSVVGIPFLDDLRDGLTYPTITIGSQTWMKINLRYNAPGSWENPSNLDSTYGRLYDWATAQTACPSGWHLPTQADWTTLQNAIGGSSVGNALKAISGWNSSGGTNSSGMNVVAAGSYVAGAFTPLGDLAVFWTSTTFSGTQSYMIKLTAGGTGIIHGYDENVDGYSCRCIMD